MTPAEYRAAYAARHSLTSEQAAALVIVPCRCAMTGCEGWEVAWTVGEQPDPRAWEGVP